MKFHIDKVWTGDYGEEIHFDGFIEINDDVIKSIDDSWIRMFYNLDAPQKIAEHIAFNMICNGWPLSHLDGFANFPDSYAQIL